MGPTDVVYPDSAEAAVEALAPDARRRSVLSPRHALQAVADGEARGAVVPVEDNEAGSDPAVLDGIARLAKGGQAQIVGERWGEAERDGGTVMTRFVLVAKTDAPVEGADRTSLVLTPSEQAPNALFRALTAFVGRRLMLYRIEPRPLAGQPGRYHYHVDVEGDAAEDPLAAALADAGTFCDATLVLGSYVGAEV